MRSHSSVTGQSASEEIKDSLLSMISIDIRKVCTEWACCKSRTNVPRNHAGIKKRSGLDWTISSNILNECIKVKICTISSKGEYIGSSASLG
jgi:hypothetical protein